MYPQNVSVESGDSLKDVQLEKGEFFVMGSFYDESIVWKVIDYNNETFAWSENAVCFRDFDDNSSDWQKSNLKKWLNDENENGFLADSNFSSAEKALISSEENEGVFILSERQLKALPESERVKAPTASAVKNYGTNKLFIRKNCWYWTSSPISTNTSSVTTVTQSGGFYKTLATDTLVGVCPAFRLTENEVTVCGGDGTREKPYVLYCR